MKLLNINICIRANIIDISIKLKVVRNICLNIRAFSFLNIAFWTLLLDEVDYFAV